MKQPKKRVKRMKGMDRRKQILATAQRIFAEESYENATIAKIAASAGITEPTIYMHFRSKKDLYLSVLNESYTSMTEQIKQLWDMPGDLFLRYSTAITGISKYLNDREYINLARLWMAAATINDPDITSIVVRLDQDLMHFLSRDIKTAARCNGLSFKYRPEAFARIIVSLLNNTATMTLSGGEISKNEMEGILSLLIDSFVIDTDVIDTEKTATD
ncbi:MAG: TetR/AcrR family transcriptional regulator [Thermodesulfobacteriota bacterium]|nr:TetR/AcrR family transcriptional regulator [Thermodesulfobacteriota bacterium]